MTNMFQNPHPQALKEVKGLVEATIDPEGRSCADSANTPARLRILRRTQRGTV